MDNLTKNQRKKCMSNIKSINTKPEIIVRKALFKKGIRYRLHVKKLPGKPDIVISRLKKAIFVNGCFWHQHKDCKNKVMPKTNNGYWKPKLKKNAKKQINDIKRLEKQGWKVYVLWECELKDRRLASKKIQQILI